MNDVNQLKQACPARQIERTGDTRPSQPVGMAVASPIVAAASVDGATGPAEVTADPETRAILAECIGIFATRGKAIRLAVPTTTGAAHQVEIRPGAGAMLTAPLATSPDLDPFFEALVELLLERLGQCTADKKES